jgi:hypothetical protein
MQTCWAYGSKGVARSLCTYGVYWTTMEQDCVGALKDGLIQSVKKQQNV